jgi:hypothetical protein
MLNRLVAAVNPGDRDRLSTASAPRRLIASALATKSPRHYRGRHRAGFSRVLPAPSSAP